MYTSIHKSAARMFQINIENSGTEMFRQNYTQVYIHNTFEQYSICSHFKISTELTKQTLLKNEN